MTHRGPAFQEEAKAGFLFVCVATLGLSYSIWDLVPRSGIESRPPALGAQSLSHWTTRGVPEMQFSLHTEGCHVGKLG